MKKAKRWICSIVSILILIGCNQKEQLREIRKEEPISLMDTWKETVEQAEDLTSMRNATILGLDIQENNQSIFQINYHPQTYKARFDSWSIFHPYKNQAVTDTEVLYELFSHIQSAPLKESSKEIYQLYDTERSIYIAYNYTDKDNSQGNPDQLLKLNLFEDSTGENFVNIVGTDSVYDIPSNLVEELFHIRPFEYVLKIPILVQMEKVEHIYIHTDDGELTLSKKGEQWYLQDDRLDEQVIIDLYTQLLDISVDGEVVGTSTENNENAELTIVFYRTDEYPDVEIKYYPFDDEYVRSSVNGVSNFLVNNKDILRMVERIRQYNQ